MFPIRAGFSNSFLQVVGVTTSQSISWTDVTREAGNHLSHILSHGTSSPPAFELPAAKYLLNLFESEGIPAVLLPPLTGYGNSQTTKPSSLAFSRPNIVAHLSGSGAEEPVLLMSHLDSAPRSLYDIELPSRDQDDSLRGCGALMGTHLSVAQAMALILLARSERPLKRTVRYVATSEGSGGRGVGLKILAENHLEHITSDIALGWGSFSWIGPDHIPCSLLTSSEKGALTLKLRAEASGGQAGVQIGTDPVNRLVKTLDLLAKIEFDLKISPISETFINSVSETIPDSRLRKIFGELNRESTVESAFRFIVEDDSVDPGLLALVRASLKTEQFVLRLDSSASEGLKPSSAEAEIMYCFNPGENVEEIAMKVVDILKSDGVYLAEKQFTMPGESELAPETQALVRASLSDADPKAKLVIGMSPWPTGMGALRKYGTSVYGWEPFANAGSLDKTLSLRGGTGEILDADDFMREIKSFYSFLSRVAI
jgi:acetylornithine deacetylase/succinyl-diaminopimelate desuccinylase-like protein